MKQLRLTLSSGEYLLVELPEDAHNVTVSKPLNKYFHLNCDLPPSRPGVTTSAGKAFFYSEFGGKKKYPSDIVVVGQLSGISGDLKEDILEGIRKEGWYTENPDGKEPEQYGECREVDKALREEWQCKEDCTLDPDKTYCFKLIQ